MLHENGNRYLEFNKGIQVIGALGQLDFNFSEYDKAGVLIQTKAEKAFTSNDIEATPTLDLIGSDIPKEKAALQWRLPR